MIVAPDALGPGGSPHPHPNPHPNPNPNPNPNQTLKDLEELGKKGLLKRPAPTKPAASEEEKEEEAQLKLRDQMPIKVEALTLEEKEQLGSRLASGDGVGMVV